MYGMSDNGRLICHSVPPGTMKTLKSISALLPYAIGAGAAMVAGFIFGLAIAPGIYRGFPELADPDKDCIFLRDLRDDITQQMARKEGKGK
jgi:hypothetical protein